MTNVLKSLIAAVILIAALPQAAHAAACPKADRITREFTPHVIAHYNRAVEMNRTAVAAAIRHELQEISDTAMSCEVMYGRYQTLIRDAEFLVGQKALQRRNTRGIFGRW